MQTATWCSCVQCVLATSIFAGKAVFPITSQIASIEGVKETICISVASYIAVAKNY